MTLLGVLVLLLVGSTLGLKQYLEVHQQTFNCDNNPERTLTSANVSNLFPLSGEFYKSFNVFGMWQIGRCTGQGRCQVGQPLPDFTPYIANQAMCVRVDGSPTAFDVRRLGDPAMSAPQLTVFDRPNFSPEAQMTVIGSQGVSSTSLSVKSLFFTGNHHWTIYDEAEFRGRGRCLRPVQDVVRRGYGFTTEAAADQSIKSVRFGCNAGHPTAAASLLLIFSLHLMEKTLQI